MGYNLTINTKFNPFTYDEMVKPLLLYKEAYDKAEEDFTNLIAQTADINEAVNRGDSPISAGVYGDYTQNLSDIVADFSKGMTLGNRQALTGLRRRYFQDIQPIAKANARRNALIEEQRQMQMKDPTMIWDNNAADISLDTLVANPNASYNPGYSGNMLTTEAAQVYSALAKEYQNNPEAMRKLVGGDYYEHVKQRGFTSEAILEAIMNSDKASPILTGVREQILEKTGIKNWSNKDAIQKAIGAINTGMWQAVGQTDAQLVNNWRSQENLQHSHAMARQASAQAHEEKMFNKHQQSNIVPLIDEQGKPLNLWMDKTSGVLTSANGSYVINPNGDLWVAGNTKNDPKFRGKGSSGNTTDDKLMKEEERMYKITKTRLSGPNSHNTMVKKHGYRTAGLYVNTKKGMKLVQEGDDREGAFLGFGTNNIVSRGGNYTLENIPPQDFIYIDPGIPSLPIEMAYPSIPRNIYNNMISELVKSGKISSGQDIEIFAIRSNGKDTQPNEIDYAIYVK